MKVVAISDIHMDFNDNYIMPESDLLVVAGDATYKGTERELVSFLSWLSKQPSKYKVFVPGNHDIDCQKNEYLWKKYARERNIIMETNGFVYIEDKILFCTAWTPYFYDWAFNGTDGLEGDQCGPNLHRLWRHISDTTIDLLISHGPPRGILDLNYKKEPCGSVIARSIADNNKDNIKNWVFGHIHASYGNLTYNNINFFNVSLLNDKYEKTNPPTQLNI
jgi:Icc-related predicted phosphoesterase